MKKLTLAALGIVALASLPVSAADWSDTSFGYRTGSKFQEPANPESFPGVINQKLIDLILAHGMVPFAFADEDLFGVFRYNIKNFLSDQVIIQNNIKRLH